MKPLTVRLESRSDEVLAELSRRYGISRSAVARRLVVAHHKGLDVEEVMQEGYAPGGDGRSKRAAIHTEGNPNPPLGGE